MAKVNFPEVFGGIVAEEAKPRTKAEIVELLKSEGDKFAAFLESLPESFLARERGSMRRDFPDGLENPLRECCSGRRNTIYATIAGS
jgi:hypothetical protein